MDTKEVTLKEIFVYTILNENPDKILRNKDFFNDMKGNKEFSEFLTYWVEKDNLSNYVNGLPLDTIENIVNEIKNKFDGLIEKYFEGDEKEMLLKKSDDYFEDYKEYVL